MDHPELLAGPNPLFEGLRPFVPFSQMPAALEREPLAGLDWRGLAPEMREPLLELHIDHFTPTQVAIEIAAAVQNGLRASLRRRNPLNIREQARINRLAFLDGNTTRAALQPLAMAASGGLVAAFTAMGKSTILRRALEVIAPTQFVIHGSSPTCGWATLTQVFYLVVDLPSNGSRHGLITRILGAMDALLGTCYAEDHRRLRNADQGLLLAIRVLSVHRVGMLILDEGQLENFEESPWQREFVLFFLALLNLGIPVVICGQPSAFSTIRKNAQVMRRFSDIGSFTLERAITGEEAWWKAALVPGIMEFCLCEEIESIGQFESDARPKSGGTPGLFFARWIEAQRLSLRRGGQVARVTPADLENAKFSPSFAELERITRWISDGKAKDLQFTDVFPNPASEEEGPPQGGNKSPLPTASAKAEAARALKRLDKAAKRDVTKKAKSHERDRALLEHLDPADLRAGNRILELLAGLDPEVQEEMPFDKRS